MKSDLKVIFILNEAENLFTRKMMSLKLEKNMEMVSKKLKVYQVRNFSQS